MQGFGHLTALVGDIRQDADTAGKDRLKDEGVIAVLGIIFGFLGIEGFAHVGELLGQTIAWKPSGGVCEGNNLHAAGLPNVDTLGVVGGEIHSDQEFAWPASFVERAQLSALILCKIASGEIDALKLKQLRLETM